MGPERYKRSPLPMKYLKRHVQAHRETRRNACQRISKRGEMILRSTFVNQPGATGCLVQLVRLQAQTRQMVRRGCAKHFGQDTNRLRGRDRDAANMPTLGYCDNGDSTWLQHASHFGESSIRTVQIL